MYRPGITAAAFLLCLIVLLAVMGWISWQAIQLDRAEAIARQQAVIEENIRLALWRMDTSAGALLAREIARPTSDYDRMGLPVQADHVRLLFKLSPDGELSSPQIVATDHRDDNSKRSRRLSPAVMAEWEALRPSLTAARLTSLLPAEPIGDVTLLYQPGSAAFAFHPDNLTVNESSLPQQATNTPATESQQRRGSQEFAARSQFLANNNGINLDMLNRSAIAGGAVTPVWLDDHLLLVRRQSTPLGTELQGSVLDVGTLSNWLLSLASDLLPNARLLPAEGKHAAEQTRLLASLPLYLDPGMIPVEPAAGHSPLHFSLLISWLCVLVAAAAVAVLIRGVMQLSERRAAFVSAVTHELRTPLTTFRMYSEMLSEGMVSGEQQRQEYLETLRMESNRLSHLVENVLAYARLERGSARGRLQTQTLGELLERVVPRLRERVVHAGGTLAVSGSDAAMALAVHTDATAVEQILFNLVDNACKYGAVTGPSGVPVAIELRAECQAHRCWLRVHDQGPGLAETARRKLFRPFSKSAHDAADTAAGVGLGLALSRRLAREMGGDLTWEPTARGACFALLLR